MRETERHGIDADGSGGLAELAVEQRVNGAQVRLRRRPAATGSPRLRLGAGLAVGLLVATGSLAIVGGIAGDDAAESASPDPSATTAACEPPEAPTPSPGASASAAPATSPDASATAAQAPSHDASATADACEPPDAPTPSPTESAATTPSPPPTEDGRRFEASIVKVESCLYSETNGSQAWVYFEISWDGEVPIWLVKMSRDGHAGSWVQMQDGMASGTVGHVELDNWKSGTSFVVTARFYGGTGGDRPGALVSEIGTTVDSERVEPCGPGSPKPRPWTWPFDPNARFEPNVEITEACNTAGEILDLEEVNVVVSWDGEIPISEYLIRLDGEIVDGVLSSDVSLNGGLSGGFPPGFTYFLPLGEMHIFTIQFYAPNGDNERGTPVREVTMPYVPQAPIDCTLE